ncbi:dTDP-glucose 4,6-dehydratase [Iocasia frigidifontis]|uniref:dTDP-glucose 4,6-dehydratase n=1 Tax=Iocasia fonsfrigidae TaxID=2682810 RepID=A0A8A7KCQ6_9FIRM|nr:MULTISPECIES: dTDP-glucose 4,6-dehydratase [Halanaerobiaceae]AZO93383.1 dTDP-glucose 4,6-dehydratase [Halocella sp. SP3-1]QTL99633.1 dTDP-glucose 4,6-dehydratase [Iocasia fonsfrigidae]
MKLLVTGGAGFIGSNFIHYILEHYDDEVLNLDKLTYAGNLNNLKGLEDNEHYKFVKGDIADKELVDGLMKQGVDVIINFAAESHVDRSIKEADVFIQTNISGAQVLLEAAVKYKINKFIQVSTDEVYGSLGAQGLFTEEDLLQPSSPYSASKAGADLLVDAYHKTYGLPVNITRCSNNYGPYQYPEKLIPLLITNALNNRELPLYGDGGNIRDWIHVGDHCRAVDVVLRSGKAGEIYNIGSNNEKRNIEIAEAIINILGKDRGLIKFVKDRPGHDRRYAIDYTKLRQDLGWRPKYDFSRGLKETIEWYCTNEDWWRVLKTHRMEK